MKRWLVAVVFAVFPWIVRSVAAPAGANEEQDLIQLLQSGASPRETTERSVTVLADRCVDAEPCAVSIFGLPQDRALAFARSQISGAEVITIA